MRDWKGKTVIQKVLCLLFVCSQTTCVLAQHYSGRHVTDDNYGSSSGSGGGFIIILLIAVVGFVVYILIHRNQNKVNNYTTNSEDKPRTQSDYIKQNADYYNRIIEENKRRKKESEDTFKGCIWGLILVGLFILGCIIHNHSESSPINSKSPDNKSQKSTSSSLTDENGNKLNNMESIMQYINENKQQTDNKGK